MIFRELSPQEEVEFRQWARKNYTPNRGPSMLWHPVIRDEWAKIEQEQQA